MSVGDLGPQRRDPREIYVLRDPRTGEARYVGESISAQWRVLQHVSRARGWPSSAKDEWLAELAAAGLRPVVEVLQTGVPFAERKTVEYQWIDAFREAGHPLLNRERVARRAAS